MAERLRDIRRRLGLTQQEVADGAGVHRTTYGQVERGRPPDYATMRAVCRVLGVRAEDVTEFANGDPDPPPGGTGPGA